MRLTKSYHLLLTLTTALAAQDTRHITEPVIPPICTTIPAQLHTTSGALAEADEQKLDTARIQKALDLCGKGRAVALASQGPQDTFLSGPLQLRTGTTLLIQKGVTLLGSRNPRVYEIAPNSCGLVNEEKSQGCKPLIAVINVQDAAVMGEGTIDARGGSPLLNHPGVTWWTLAERARTHGRQQVPRILVADHADNFTLYKITLKNSPNFHVVYNHGDGFTVWGLKIDTPQRGVRNTDGIDPGGSKNITIAHSFIRTGDDNVAIKGGDAISNISIEHNHFYYGHGMSIGSETNGGVAHIRVSDLSLDGPDSGIRIKSMGTRGGLVQDVVYDDVCIRNSPRPIDLSASYSANGPVLGNSPPTFAAITLSNVRVSGGGKIFLDGYDHTHRTSVTLSNVLLTGSIPYTYSVHHADIHLGPGSTNLQLPPGEDSTITGTPTPGSPGDCTQKLVPFPAQ